MEDNCKEQVDKDITRDPVVFNFGGIVTLWVVVNVFLMIVVIGGNLLTICALRICRRLRAVVSNIFILSLAVSDFIVGLTLPYHMAFYLGSGLGRFHIFCLLKFYIIIFASCISMWNLISIAVDRYIAIMYPLHYKRFMTRRVAIITVGVGWVVGTLLACIPLIWNHWSTAARCEFDQILPAWYIAGIVAPGFFTLWICMLIIYLRIWREASKQVKQLRKTTGNKRKSVQFVLIIMGCFTICWLPYFIVACGQISNSNEISPIIYRGVLVLAMANSGLNPLIYAWKNSNFRKSFGLLLRCKSPNVINSMEYSEQHCPRKVLRAPDQPAYVIPSPPIAVIQPIENDLAAETQEPEVGRPNSVPTNDRAINNELNAAQLCCRSQTNNNLLPMFIMMANESYIPTARLCSPCAIYKLLIARKAKISKHLKGTLAPWKLW